jgi:predicted permease
MSLGRFIRPALRALLRRRGFTTVVVLTLTLAIGVTTAVFSIFNGVLLTPLAFPDPQELVAVYDTQPSCATCPASFPKYNDWVERNRVFQKIGGATWASFVLTGSGDAERIRAARTTSSFFDVFGIAPKAGRWYRPEEDRPGGPKLAVLTHSFWLNRCNGSPGTIGQKLVLDGEPYEVIGIMPPEFEWGRAEVFVPLQMKLDPNSRGNHFLPVFARLKKGMTLEAARREMRSLGDTLAKEFGNDHGIDVQSYTEVMVGGMRTPLQVLLGAVLLLLAIGAANVANLMLESGLARRREMAIHLSLGATLRQLAAMLVTEGVCLAAAAGVLGVLVSKWIVSAFVTLAGNQLPRASTIHLDGRVLAFSAVVTVTVGIVCSLFPVMLLREADLAAGVREGDVRGGSRSGNFARRALVVTEIALAFALLLSSALLIKNLILLRSRDSGLRTARIVSFQVALGGPRYANDIEVKTFYRALYERLRQLDGVKSAGLTSHLPMVDFGYNGYFQIEGETPWRPNQAPLVEYRWLYGDYLKTLGVPLLQGRPLGERDAAGTRTVLITKAMADKFWPGKDPIGRRFGQGLDHSQWFEVVGVIGSMRSFGLTRSYPFEFYRTVDQSPFNRMTAVVETRAEDPLSILPAARQVVKSLDPSLPVTEVRTMERAVSESLGRPRLMSALIGLFGGLAGLLAVVGIYSVMSYSVSRQRREFGIRLALGAAPGAVRRLVLGRGLLLALIGIAIGMAGAMAASRLLQSLLQDVKPADPAVYAFTVLGIAVVALAACFVPAWSAGRVNPMDTLRSE